MGAALVPFSGPVVADTVYSDNTLVARDVAITLPEVTPFTAELPAMGTLSMPVWQLLEHMEAAITKVGTDLGLFQLLKPDMKPLEFRWVQTITDVNGVTETNGCKAFIKGIPNKIPSIGLNVGDPTENECTIAVVRYGLFVGGKEMLLIDRLAGICRINGTDYAKGVSSLL